MRWRFLAWTVALLVGCSADQLVDIQEERPRDARPPPAFPFDPPAPPAPDDDGDGFRANDCDDADPDVHPLAGEICNGRDDDCDGVADELEDVAALCFDAPAQTLLHPPCRAGVVTCQDGHAACTGQILPAAEVCNGRDDDCDGTMDEGTVSPFDAVLVLDVSGSMTAHLGRLAVAFRELPTWEGLRLGLVVAPGRDGAPAVLVPLGPPVVFQVALERVFAAGRCEPTLEALAGVIGAPDPWALGWRAAPERQLVILATDEVLQACPGPVVLPKAVRPVLALTPWSLQASVAAVASGWADLEAPAAGVLARAVPAACTAHP